MTICTICLRDDTQTKFGIDKRYGYVQKICNKCAYQLAIDPDRKTRPRGRSMQIRRAKFLLYWNNNKGNIKWT